MLLKTHLAIALFSILFLIDHVTYKFAFVIITLVATVLPDVGSAFSLFRKRGETRPAQFLSRHRGFIHSLTFCALLSFLLTAYFPIYALPFFLGYSIHLFADSFTVEGIRPLWPLKFHSKGPVRVGGSVEHVLFVGFCIVDAVLLFGFFI